MVIKLTDQPIKGIDSAGANGITSLLESVNIHFSYENGYKVFENINISVGQDKFVAIVGPSGIGKSTFLRIMAFIKPGIPNSY